MQVYQAQLVAKQLSRLQVGQPYVGTERLLTLHPEIGKGHEIDGLDAVVPHRAPLSLPDYRLLGVVERALL